MGLLAAINRRVALRLTLAVFLFGAVVVALTAAGQAWLSYREHQARAEQAFATVEASYRQPLANALWSYNERLIRAQLQGMLQLPYVVGLEVMEQGKLLASAGRKARPGDLRRRFELTHLHQGQRRRIGELVVVASLEGAWARLSEGFWRELALRGGEVFLLALFLVALGRAMLTRHLGTIADHVRGVDFRERHQPLNLGRGQGVRDDELGQVARAVNQMAEDQHLAFHQLQSELARRREAEESLRQAYREVERRVMERTSELAGANQRLRREVAERQRSEQGLVRKNQLLDAINRVFHDALTQEREEEVALTCLEVARELTGAEAGFVGELNQRGRLDTLAVSDLGWAECRLPPGERAGLLSDMEPRGLWGLVLSEERALVANQPADHPAAAGLPQGHPPVESFLGAPLLRAGRAEGMVGLANKPGGFSREDREDLEALAPAVVLALYSKRAVLATQRLGAELARSNAELEQFAYVASHDLQEPLRKVIAFSGRLQQVLGGGLDQRGADYLERLERSAARMQQLINDLLGFSRLASQARPFAATDLNQVLEEVVWALEDQLQRTGGRVEVGELPRVEGDASQLRQLFQNLVSNGLKFSRPDRPPEVRVSSRSQDDGRVELWVEDNGIGIRPQHREQVFRPFQRLHGRSEYEGSGMGLAICAKVARRHGGDIRVEDSARGGAAFVVELPRRHAPPAGRAAGEPA
jgi:signal transduction histidine kinase